MNEVSFGPHSFSDLDFADDVALLGDLLEHLIGLPALETMVSDAVSVGLAVNWRKIKVGLNPKRPVPDILRRNYRHSCGYTESRQPDLEVKNIHFN